MLVRDLKVYHKFKPSIITTFLSSNKRINSSLSGGPYNCEPIERVLILINGDE